MKNKGFSPLLFLASLGAGGVAVMPFVLFQYSIEHGKGLITRAMMPFSEVSAFTGYFYNSLEIVMVVFALLHFVLTAFFLVLLFRWFRTKEFSELLNDPLKNTALLAPLISIAMTMNVFIGPIRYFVPLFSDNFQSLFLPAMIFWSFLYLATLLTTIKLLKISFEKGFDVGKISFGWLLYPFALGMITVVGTGIAAMSANASIANIAAFMSLITGTMGVFLLAVKLVMIFKSHFAAPSMPEKYFLPSFLIVIPNITLYAISAFRLGHYIEHTFGYHMDAFSFLVISGAFAFEVWYGLFGLFMLKDYFQKHYFKKEFYVTQWGLICPIVAFAVLGSFFYTLFFESLVVYAVIIITMAVAVIFYVDLLYRHAKCSGILNSGEMNCPR